MIRLQSISITNIGSIEHLDLTIDDAGVTALYGPSGVGKTTILNAVPWCLWGDTGDAGNHAALRRTGSTGPASVTCQFTVGGTEVTATRVITRKRSGAETSTADLTINSAVQPNITASALTQKSTAITGMTAKTFRAAYYLSQEHLTDLVRGAPTHVQAVFEDLTRLGELDKRIRILRDESNQAGARADALPGDPSTAAAARNEADEAESAAFDAEAEAVVAEQARAAVQQASTAADTAVRELLDADRTARTAADNATHAAATAAAAHTAEAECRDALGDDVEASANDAQVAADDISRRLDDLSAAGAALSHAIASRTDADDAVHQLPTPDLNSLLETHEATSITKSDLQSRERALRERLSVLHTGHERVERATSALQHADGSDCPTCGNHLADPTAIINNVTDELDQIVAETHQTQGELHELAKEITAAESDCRQAEQNLRLGERAEDRRAEAAAAASRSHQAVRTATAAVAAMLSEAATTDPDEVRAAARDQHTQLKQDLRAHDARVNAWTAWTNAQSRSRIAQQAADKAASRVPPAPTEAEIRAAQTSAAQARATYETAAAVASTARADANACSMNARNANYTAAAEEKQWAAKEEASIAAEITRCARDIVIALRRELLGEYTESVSMAATEVMERLGGEHVGFELDGDFIPRVQLPDGTTRPTRLISGGEKARAALCAFIAIGQQLCGGQAPGMLFADEITAAQDETYRREILNMLRSLGIPMIVVSHTSDILDIATHVIELERPTLTSTSVAA